MRYANDAQKWPSLAGRGPRGNDGAYKNSGYGADFAFRRCTRGPPHESL